MAVKQGHLLAVGGVAIVALAGGFGIARATGGEEQPKQPAVTSAKEKALPPVEEQDAVKIASLGAAPALPAPKRTSRGKSGGASSGGRRATPPTSTPQVTPQSTSAPPASTPPPVTPQQTTQPQPERTPVVGGGTGGE